MLNQFEDNSIDILHQDANHSVESSCEEVRLFSPKIKKGGYWIMDDTNWDTTKPAQKLLIELGFILKEDHQNWAIYQSV